MNLPVDYIGERVVERGILMATMPSREPLATPTPIEQAVQQAVATVIDLVRPVVSEPKTPFELDKAIDRLLFNDELFDLFIDLSKLVGISAVEAVFVDGFESMKVENVVGKLCVDRMRFLVRENASALFDFLNHMRENPPPPKGGESPFPAHTLLKPSLYMRNRHIAPELKRALLGRDIGQLMFTGIAFSREWNLPAPRVIELCERFIENQSMWLEFLNILPGVHVAEDALPKTRTNFGAAFLRSAKANESLDRASDYLDKSGEPAYFFVERDDADESSGG